VSGICVTYLNGWDFEDNIDELCGVFMWATQIGKIFGAILVNWVGYLCGMLKWLRFWVQYWWIWWSMYVSGTLKCVGFWV
jgi:hypothetical protein